MISYLRNYVRRILTTSSHQCAIAKIFRDAYMRLMAYVGKLLRQTRKTLGITQSQIAASLGVRRQTVQDTECDKRQLTEAEIGRLPPALRLVIVDPFIAEHKAAIGRLTQMKRSNYDATRTPTETAAE